MTTVEITKEQQTSVQNYKRMGIDIDIDTDTDVVRVYQKRLVNGYILNQKEFHERAREIFPDAKIQPISFSLDVSAINQQWVENKMNELGIKRSDLIKQLALDKSYISLLFADDGNERKISLSKSMKAMFYYYFLTDELNRDFREYLNQ
jgi:hypothetical protein